MTRYSIIALLMMLLPTVAGAQSLIQQADSAYTSDEFETAANLYREAMVKEGSSASLYYNLGNCYYRLGEMGKAIVAYERALRLDPANEDARENLDFVNSRITDRAGERGTFIGNALDAVANKTRSNVWAWTALTLFLLAVGGVLLYFFSSSIPLRKTGFFGSIVLVLLSGAGIFFALRSAAIATADNVAVIIAPSTILSTAPRTPSDRSLEAMLLHEGTRVEILDSVTSTSDSIPALWLDVQVDNTHRAWIKAADVERI